jgi:hypothetical protein
LEQDFWLEKFVEWEAPAAEARESALIAGVAKLALFALGSWLQIKLVSNSRAGPRLRRTCSVRLTPMPFKRCRYDAFEVRVERLPVQQGFREAWLCDKDRGVTFASWGRDRVHTETTDLLGHRDDFAHRVAAPRAQVDGKAFAPV